MAMVSRDSMYFKAVLTREVDTLTLWHQIGRYHRVNFSEENGLRVIYFTGDKEDGEKVMAIVQQYTDETIEASYGF